MKTIEINENGLFIVFAVSPSGALKLLNFSARPYDESQLHYRDIEEGFNLFELDLTGFDRPQERHGTKYIGCAPGYRMQYVSSEDGRNKDGRIVKIVTRDELTDIYVTSTLQFYDGLSIVRIFHTAENRGDEMQTITHFGCFEYSAIERGGDGLPEDKMLLTMAHNKWQGELLFHTYRLDELGLEKTQPDTFVRRSSNLFRVFNAGNWSTKHYLPMGYLENTKTNLSYFWQIEHNGSWGYEISDQNDHLYLQLYGPTENESHWFKNLKKGESFTTVPVAFGSVSMEGSDVGVTASNPSTGALFDASMGMLTNYRRRIRRPNEDNEKLPIIFNDYMNCLFGDPTTEKEMPLIEAAAKAGCEYFVIDAGWYAKGDWWDSVGEWQESRERFPNGLKEVADKIREKGMIPGAWLEIEVMGIKCKKAGELPDECFFMRHGKRIYDRSRYQLDFRHPLVIEHANEVVDRMISDYGIGYIKMDYNIEPGFGTEIACDSPGEGLLEHERAYIAWLDSVWERHPELVIENCSSGGLRMDYAMLSRYSIQSTSDQENYKRYSMITCNAPAALTPEQAAVWSYPLRDSSSEDTIFNMINAIPLRIHQSGHLGELKPQVLELVIQGLNVYRQIRTDIAHSVPFWPCGLAKIHDSYHVLGLDATDACNAGDDKKHAYLAVWSIDTKDQEVVVPLSRFVGRDIEVKLIYPQTEPIKSMVDYRLDKDSMELKIKFAEETSARLFQIDVK